MGQSRPLFLYFRLFNKQLTVNMFNKSCQCLCLWYEPLTSSILKIEQMLSEFTKCFEPAKLNFRSSGPL